MILDDFQSVDFRQSRTLRIVRVLTSVHDQGAAGPGRRGPGRRARDGLAGRSEAGMVQANRMQHYVRPDGLPPVSGYSHAVAFSGRMVVVSGQVPLDDQCPAGRKG